MCGRARTFITGAELARIFKLDEVPEDLALDAEIRPTDPLPVLRVGADGRRRLTRLRWGLLPPWSNGPSRDAPRIHARVESVATRAPFRDAFRARRCVVIVDAFYEWKRDGSHKTPYLVTRDDGGPMAMAGLWERWTSPDGEIVETCAIVTRDAAGVIATLHDRMPVILPVDAADAWLDPSRRSAADVPSLEAILAESLTDGFVASPLAPPGQLRMFG